MRVAACEATRNRAVVPSFENAAPSPELLVEGASNLPSPVPSPGVSSLPVQIPDGAAHDLAMIVRSAREAIIAWTPDGTVVTWNPAAEKLFAIDAAHAIGRDLARMMPEGLSR